MNLTRLQLWFNVKHEQAHYLQTQEGALLYETNIDMGSMAVIPNGTSHANLS